MEQLLERLEGSWQELLARAPDFALAAVLVVASWWLGRLAGRGAARLLERGSFTLTHKAFFRTLTRWLVTLLGLILALNVLGLQAVAAGLLAGGGITAVALGFAFRQIGENFLAGFFLAFSRPFEVGHLIQSGELVGVVKGIELRSTHIRTADGRDIFIPSGQIFNNPLINFTRDGLRRPSFKVGIDYGGDPGAACRRLLAAVQSVPGVLADPAPSVYVDTFAPLYLELEVTFWINTFAAGVDLFRIRGEVMERCLAALKEGGFALSADVVSSVALGASGPLVVRLREGGSGPEE